MGKNKVRFDDGYERWDKNICQQLKKEAKFKDKTKFNGGIKMPVTNKSRYEVISDLEEQKRKLIEQRDSLDNDLETMKRQRKGFERQKEDYNREIDRKIADQDEEVKKFESQMNERKETIKELIKSVDQSLDRFGQMNKSK